ncbi:hypothetical protein NDU88_005396 [Pleurodeles waltl]|uniref:Uncharacterized protein n=1 Tax=Pleurodeles waltl TaxID=8319 RepID=A0AAV7RM04_PLEWA|nr:hypothetical protein NDU88_005396 [Pleurodeles waltl]
MFKGAFYELSILELTRYQRAEPRRQTLAFSCGKTSHRSTVQLLTGTATEQREALHQGHKRWEAMENLENTCKNMEQNTGYNADTYQAYAGLHSFSPLNHTQPFNMHSG